MWRRMILAAPAVFVASAVRAVSPAPEPTALLSPANLTAHVALSAQPARDVTLLVDVVAVRNPQRVPVSMRVSLQDVERKAPPAHVMRFALFPADKPGRFVGRADDALARLTAALGVPPDRLVATIQFDDGSSGAAFAPPVELDIRVAWLSVEPKSR